MGSGSAHETGVVPCACFTAARRRPSTGSAHEGHARDAGARAVKRQVGRRCRRDRRQDLGLPVRAPSRNRGGRAWHPGTGVGTSTLRSAAGRTTWPAASWRRRTDPLPVFHSEIPRSWAAKRRRHPLCVQYRQRCVQIEDPGGHPAASDEKVDRATVLAFPGRQWLRSAIERMLPDRAMVDCTSALGANVRAEDGPAEAVQAIEQACLLTVT